MNPDVVAVHQVHIFAARAVGVEVAALKAPIGAHKGQLRQDVGHHAGFVGDADQRLAVELAFFDAGLYPPHGLIDGIEHPQRVLFQGHGGVGVLAHFGAEGFLPLPAQHGGHGGPCAQQHDGTEHAGHHGVGECWVIAPACGVEVAGHDKAAGMVSV